MTRDEKILHSIKRGGKGLEIGPSYNPIAPKSKGFDVRVLDHATRDELIAKYNAHGVNTSRIEDVDYIWSGQRLSSIVGESQSFDWIIASHVIEHTPDLVGFLQSCQDLLAPGGVVSLAIPDKRYCFDFFRERTSLAQVIDAREQARSNHSVGTAAEHFLNAVAKDGAIAWGAGYPGEYQFANGIDHARIAMASLQTAYVDCHAWVFTPWSFRLMMRDLRDLGYLRLKEVAFHDSVGCEFFVALGLDGQEPAMSRMDMLKLSNLEQISPSSSADSFASQLLVA